MEYAYYLNHFGPYTGCTNGDGAILTSGVDCVPVTDDVRDLGVAGWGDRSDLYIKVVGNYEVWAYDSVDYLGPAKVVRSGQTLPMGGNISSIDIKPLSSDPSANTTEPFGVDEKIVHYYQMEEVYGGATIFDEVGSLNGSK